MVYPNKRSIGRWRKGHRPRRCAAGTKWLPEVAGKFGARWSAVEWNARLWRQSIERFKAFMIPVTAPLGRSKRRVAAACYVQGLLMPGQRTVPPVSMLRLAVAASAYAFVLAHNTTQRAFRTPPLNALSDCCTFGLVLASRAVREKKTASKTPYEAFRTARRPQPLSPHQSCPGPN